MAVKFNGYDFANGGVCAAKGFLAAGIHCGLRKNKTKPDLAMIFSAVPCIAAAVYTQNKVKGAPIVVTMEHLKNGKAQGVIVNSGNANTCNIDGEEKAKQMCGLAAAELGIAVDDMVVASTGVIGEIMPIEPFQKAMPKLKTLLAPDGNVSASQAILTTDTHSKEIAVTFSIGDKICTIGGMAKGSGMIHPNMATMLCFITTDVAIRHDLLQQALSTVVKDTFNMISIDGDTSTNDMVSLLASGTACNTLIDDPRSEDYAIFANGLYAVMMNLSRLIAQDGEGATKLLECTVCNAGDVQTAKTIAKSVITSSLFKSAMFGEDANWGRILCAVGYADAEFDIDKVCVRLKSILGDILVCHNGSGVFFDEETASQILTADEIKIIVDLGAGNSSAVAWGCDLTYDYVKINGSYRS